MNRDKRDLVNFRLAKAKETLREVHFHIENELWFTAINRLYYACFYAIIALLYDNDIETKTHSGARQMFGQHFIKTEVISKDLGEFYTDLFNKRHRGDYDDFVVFEKEDVIPLMALAERFINEIDRIISAR